MCYFDNATSRTQLTVDAICHELKNPKFGEVDLVVGIGFSGTLLLAAIHIQSGIPFGAIRKDKNCDHSCRSVETGGIPGLYNTKRYIIIDDFTETGETLSNIKVKMAGHECVGIILYQDWRLNDGNTLSEHPNTPLICLACDIEEVVMINRNEKWETCGV